MKYKIIATNTHKNEVTEYYLEDVTGEGDFRYFDEALGEADFNQSSMTFDIHIVCEE